MRFKHLHEWFSKIKKYKNWEGTCCESGKPEVTQIIWRNFTDERKYAFTMESQSPGPSLAPSRVEGVRNRCLKSETGSPGVTSGWTWPYTWKNPWKNHEKPIWLAKNEKMTNASPGSLRVVLVLHKARGLDQPHIVALLDHNTANHCRWKHTKWWMLPVQFQYHLSFQS